MDVVIFPNAKNAGVIPPVNMYTSEHIQITKKEMMDILKFHKKDKLNSIIFRYGDPMDNGVEFYLQLIDLLDNDPRYEKTRIIIETPLITFLKRYGAWQKVVENDRILVKATFSFGEKESSGKFFSNSNLMDAYSRFWNSFRYRPVLIYYKLDENDKYAPHMETLANVLKTTLEVRPVWGMMDKSWATEKYFYSNDYCRYISSLVWFEEDPSKYEISSDKERRDIRKKREVVETKLRERKEKAERQAESRRKEDEREEAMFKALRISKEIEEAKKKQPPIRVIREKCPIIRHDKPKPAPKKRISSKTNKGLDDSQKKKLQEIRDKTIEKLNNKPADPKKPIDLYDAISRFRAQNHLG